MAPPPRPWWTTRSQLASSRRCQHWSTTFFQRRYTSPIRTWRSPRHGQRSHVGSTIHAIQQRSITSSQRPPPSSPSSDDVIPHPLPLPILSFALSISLFPKKSSRSSKRLVVVAYSIKEKKKRKKESSHFPIFLFCKTQH